MFKLHQIKGYFSFSTVVSPKGGFSVIICSFELLELSLSQRVTKGSNSAFHSKEARHVSGGTSSESYYSRSTEPYSSVLQYIYILKPCGKKFMLTPVCHT